MSNPRVIVTVPDTPPRVYHGQKVGEFTNRDASRKWVKVIVDGKDFERMFWHEYVKEIAP